MGGQPNALKRCSFGGNNVLLRQVIPKFECPTCLKICERSFVDVPTCSACSNQFPEASPGQSMHLQEVILKFQCLTCLKVVHEKFSNELPQGTCSYCNNSLSVVSPDQNYMYLQEIILSFECLTCLKIYQKIIGELPQTCSNCSTHFLEANNATRRLIFCISANAYPVPYHILSVPLARLLSGASSAELEEELQQVLFQNTSHSMNCINLEDGIYFFGGGDGDGNLKKPSPRCLRVAYSDIWRKANSNTFNWTFVSPCSPMRSGKPSSIAVEIGGILYVLGRPDFRGSKFNPIFEKYDPFAKEWFTLTSPPFLRQRSTFTDHIENLMECDTVAYAVIGKTFHISTKFASFSYDTGCEGSMWQSCTLFDGFDPYGFKGYRNPTDNVSCGSPFPFVGGAAMYGNDTLVCFSTSFKPYLLVAFQIENGRVVRVQLLDNLPRLICGQLVDLGGGCFAAVVKLGLTRAKLSVVCFKLTRSRPSKKSQFCTFLKCIVLRQATLDLGKFGDWFPSFSFVRDVSERDVSASSDTTEHMESCEATNVAETRGKRMKLSGNAEEELS